jgi:branched-chain amino acid transport system permease protein
MRGAVSGPVASLRRAIAPVPRWAWYLIFLAAAIAYPYTVIPALGLSGGDLLDASITALAYVVMALGLNIVVGFAGLLDLGYVAFYAIGAFVIGWLGSAQFPNVAACGKNAGPNCQDGIHVLVSKATSLQPGIHLNFLLIVVIAMLFTAMWGAILGAPTLRLRGDYLAIVTLAFGEIVPRVFENSTSGFFGIGSINWSNGKQGITPIDNIYLPIVGQLNAQVDIKPLYYVALVLVMITLYINFSLRDSRLGRAWIAVREDEVAAAAMGVNLVRTKLWAYATGAALGGMAGVFLGTYTNDVNVDNFKFGFSVFVLCMVIIGGMGNIAGVVLGAIALAMLDRFGLPQINQLHLGFDVTSINYGIFGFFLLVMMVLRPEGFLPSRRRKLELTQVGVEDTALYEVRE